MNIKDLVIGVKKLESQVFQQELEREEIKNSDRYREIEEGIQRLKEAQLEMTKGVEDSSLELEEKKQELMEFMIQTGVDKTDGASITYKTKKQVNIDMARGLMGDDLMAYIKITQKDLKDYADQFKGANDQYAKDVMACVEIISKDPVGIKLS
jgi:hypothetical protein